ncbi:MAG TPA: hypothetical protein DIW17_15010 [Clostridiales bacterium]|nr:hypothetical protein [Clostridiales bacterium]
MNKREITDILKQLDEIPLPDKEKILSVCPQPIDTGDEISTVNHRKLRFKPVIAVCTAFILLIFGVSTYAIAAENKEYKEAVMFFEDYDLPLDGLSRGEIKKVYRDIKTGTFTYGKTAEVIEKSIISSTVSGQELFQDDPTPEELANIWNNNYGPNQLPNLNYDENNVAYRHYSKEKFDSHLGIDVHDKSFFEKYIDDKLTWTVEFSDWIHDYVVLNDSVIVYGTSPAHPSTQRRYAWISLIDNDGKIMWRRMLDNGFKDEYIGAIVPDDDKIVVFSRGDLKYLCFNELGLNGARMDFYKTEVGNTGIWNAAKLGDEYIVQLGNYMRDESALIVKVSSDGRITDTFSYESDDSNYYITDMIEYNSLIYLSTYSVPALEDEDRDTGSRWDVVRILYYIFDNELYDISDEELTKLMRENFTAVLLVCDPSSGTPQEFFSVKGSLGGKLAISDSKKLLWDVQNISDSHFSPTTSAFSIVGASYVYRYTFDENGVILSQEKTGEVEKFFR